jgi:hypothetical protein
MNASHARDGSYAIKHAIKWDGTASNAKEASTLGMADMG